MTHGAALYLDTSVALRATLEQGTTPEIERRIAGAPALVTSRLSLVESARALLRIRFQCGVPESRLADARRELDTPRFAPSNTAALLEFRTGSWRSLRPIASR
jgi:hypothetical protein